MIYLKIYIFSNIYPKWPNFNSSTSPGSTMSTETCYIIVIFGFTEPHVSKNFTLPLPVPTSLYVLNDTVIGKWDKIILVEALASPTEEDERCKVALAYHG